MGMPLRSKWKEEHKKYRAGYSLKFRWGGFSNREAVRWGKGGAGRAKRAEKFFPPHLTNPRPMGRGFFRWGGKFPPFNTVNTGKTGFMPANFVIHNLSSSQLSQISPNSNLKAFWKMFWSTSWDYFIIIILLKFSSLKKSQVCRFL